MTTHSSGPVALRAAAVLAIAAIGAMLGALPAAATQLITAPTGSAPAPAGVLLASVPSTVPIEQTDAASLTIEGAPTTTDGTTRLLADDPACVIGLGEHPVTSTQVDVVLGGYFTVRLIDPDAKLPVPDALSNGAEGTDAAAPDPAAETAVAPTLVVYSAYEPAAPDTGVVGCNADYDALPGETQPGETLPAETPPAGALPAESDGSEAPALPLPTFASTLEPGRYTVVVADPADTTLEIWGAAGTLALVPTDAAAPEQPAAPEPAPEASAPEVPAPETPSPEAPTPAEDPAPLVTAAPTITSPAIADVVTAGDMYSRTITADSAAPVEFIVTDGSLPEGISLDAGTGELAGIPVAEGDYSFTISASNEGGFTSQAGTISVGIAPVVLSVDFPFDAVVGTDYSGSLSVEGTGSITFSLDGALPDGLSFDAATGVVSGVPTAEGAASFTVTATNAFGSIGESAEISVGPSPDAPTFVTGSFTQELTAGAEYSILVTGQGTGRLSFAVSRGSLPRGLSLNRSTGVISGVPTGGGATFTLALSNPFGTVTQTNTITVTGTATAANSTLPVTGASVDDPAASAGWLLVLGVALVVIARVRRRPATRR